MSCEVRMYCDTCATTMLIDEHGMGTFRQATGDAIANAIRCGFRRTKKGWQCPGCLVGMPNVFDQDQHDEALRETAERLYEQKFGCSLPSARARAALNTEDDDANL